MRRTLVALMVLVYLCCSVGILTASHFCRGKETSRALFTTKAKKCACESGREQTGHCCNDQQGLILLKNDQNALSVSVTIPVHFYILEEFHDHALALAEEVHHVAHRAKDPAPPKIPRWRKHCSIVLYDDTIAA